jgi:hypothetical protein
VGGAGWGGGGGGSVRSTFLNRAGNWRGCVLCIARSLAWVFLLQGVQRRAFGCACCFYRQQAACQMPGAAGTAGAAKPVGMAKKQDPAATNSCSACSVQRARPSKRTRPGRTEQATDLTHRRRRASNLPSAMYHVSPGPWCTLWLLCPWAMPRYLGAMSLRGLGVLGHANTKRKDRGHWRCRVKRVAASAAALPCKGRREKKNDESDVHLPQR